MNMTEDYVSFEVAKLLKNKGFDEECIGAYSETNHTITRFEPNVLNSEVGPLMYSAPTLQMAMKWLRKVYNLHIVVDYDTILSWYYQVKDLKEKVSYDYDDEELLIYHNDNESNYTSYEEACEAAIKYCFENLI